MFLVHHDAATGRIATIDGRETAPAAGFHADVDPSSVGLGIQVLIAVTAGGLLDFDVPDATDFVVGDGRVVREVEPQAIGADERAVGRRRHVACPESHGSTRYRRRQMTMTTDDDRDDDRIAPVTQKQRDRCTCQQDQHEWIAELAASDHG